MSSFQLKFFPEVYARADDASQNIYCTCAREGGWGVRAG